MVHALGVHGDEIVGVVAAVAPRPPSPRSHRRPSSGLKSMQSSGELFQFGMQSIYDPS